MEWNSARLKLPVLAGEAAKGGGDAPSPVPQPVVSPFAGMSLGELCKIGFALTWPLLLVALAALGVLRRDLVAALIEAYGVCEAKRKTG